MNQQLKKEASNNMSLVDVNKILDDYSLIEKKFSELNGKNNILKAQLENSKRLGKLSHAKEIRAKEDCAAFQEIVTGLQETIELQCNIRDENYSLKNNVRILEEKLHDITQEHNKKIDILTSIIKNKEDEYKMQMEKTTCDMDVKLVLKEEEMNTLLGKKEEEIEKLRQQLKSIEREKQSELIKQQIEFNAKLAKIQSKPTKMYQDTSTVSHNIYRMKLQHMQEEKNLEIERLRSRIKDLERQASSVQESRLKRRRF